MSERKHTPGPWKLEVGDHSHRYSLVTDEDDRTIHYKYGSGTAYDAEKDEANARLIAASPEILGALTEIVASFGKPIPHSESAPIQRARAAIAKATGK